MARVKDDGLRYRLEAPGVVDTHCINTESWSDAKAARASAEWMEDRHRAKEAHGVLPAVAELRLVADHQPREVQRGALRAVPRAQEPRRPLTRHHGPHRAALARFDPAPVGWARGHHLREKTLAPPLPDGRGRRALV